MTTTTRPLVASPASSRNGTAPQEREQSSSLSPKEAFRQLSEAGAIVQGHFQYESGRHGEIYVEKFRLLERPGTVRKIAETIANEFRDQNVALVVGPTTGGWLLAHETAEALSDGARSFCAEPRSGGGREFRRGFRFADRERVIVVDDVLTTGGSLRDTIQAVRDAGGEPIAVGVIVDRTNGQTAFEDLPFFACLSIEAASWPADDCPLCDDGVELVVT